MRGGRLAAALAARIQPGGILQAGVSDVFIAGSDSVITLTGDVSAFCIEGYSLANDGASRAATHYATSDVSNTVPGTCRDGVLVPAP